MSRTFTNNSNQALSGGSPVALDNQEPFTVAAWILPVNMSASSAGRIVCKDSQGAIGFWGLQFTGGTTNPGSFEFLKDYATSDLEIISNNNAITFNTWQHVAASWDGNSSGGVILYVNAIAVGTQAISTTGVGAKQSDAANEFRIGNRTGGGVPATESNRPFNGAIGPVEFHKGVLTAGQLGQLMAFPGSVDWRQSIGFWTLNSPGAATATSGEFDYSANSPQIPLTPTSAVFVLSFPPINGLSVIPCPRFVGCA